MFADKKRNITCCFTGHRDMPAGESEQVRRWLKAVVLNLYQSHGVRYFGAGGALGFDTLAAETVLELRADWPALRLILVLPYPGQEERWAREEQRRYQDILERADKVVYTAPRYAPGCFHVRNRHLVDHAGWCIAYLTRDRGGTAYTVAYAKSRGLRVVCWPQADVGIFSLSH